MNHIRALLLGLLVVFLGSTTAMAQQVVEPIGAEAGDKFQRLLASPPVGPEFGTAVAISGRVIAISSSAPAVYLFESQARGGWHQTATIVPPGGNATPRQLTVALGRGLLAIGDRTTNAFDGAVYLYRRSAQDEWSFERELSGNTSGGQFGSNVTIAGQRVLVSETNGQNQAGLTTGTVHVFDTADWKP